MSVKGYLVYVPFENVASMEYGNNGAPDKATVATAPGHIAGPFEVEQVIQDASEMAAALRSAVRAGACRAQEAMGHLMSTCMVSPEEAAALISGGQSVTCPQCGRTSWNPNDVREGFCSNCHDWTSAGSGKGGVIRDGE